jgi:hypothetical protein
MGRTPASTPPTNASPSTSNKEAAPPRTATDPPAGATHTTRSPGPTAAAPASSTADSCAPSTTAQPTTPTTRHTPSPAANSGSTAEHDPFPRALDTAWTRLTRTRQSAIGRSGLPCVGLRPPGAHVCRDDLAGPVRACVRTVLDGVALTRRGSGPPVTLDEGPTPDPGPLAFRRAGSQPPACRGLQRQTSGSDRTAARPMARVRRSRRSRRVT